MTAEQDKHLHYIHDIILDAWKFAKTWMYNDRPEDWSTKMDDEFIALYRKYDGPNNDFAHRILDAVLGEVLKHHETGGET